MNCSEIFLLLEASLFLTNIGLVCVAQGSRFHCREPVGESGLEFTPSCPGKQTDLYCSILQDILGIEIRLIKAVAEVGQAQVKLQLEFGIFCRFGLIELTGQYSCS